MTPTTIDSSHTHTAAVESARRERRDGAKVVSGTEGDAFAAMLDATRLTAQARTLAETRESPSQMFEAKGEREASAKPEEGAERTSQKNKTITSASEVPVNVTTTTAPGSAHDDRSTSGPASSAATNTRTSTSTPPANPAAVSVGSDTPPPVMNESPSRGDGSGPTRQDKPAPALKQIVNPPAGGPIVATNASPSVQRAMPSAGGEATPARSVGEVLGGRALESAAAARGATTESSSPGDRSAASRAAPYKAESSPPGETAKTAVPDSDNNVTPFERLVRSLRMQVGERYSTARMRLNPPELGEMRVDVHLRGDAVELEVRTMDENARRIVAGRADELRSALERSGVTVRRFDVMVDETMVATFARPSAGSPAASTPKRKNREVEDRAEVRQALSRRGRLDVRG